MEFLMLLLIGFGLLVLLFVWSGGKITTHSETIYPFSFNEKTRTVYIYKHHHDKVEIDKALFWLNKPESKKYYRRYEFTNTPPIFYQTTLEYEWFDSTFSLKNTLEMIYIQKQMMKY